MKSARARYAAWAALMLALTGCDTLLGLDDPKLVDDATDPANIAETCSDGTLRCESGGGAARSKCSAGKWTDFPCEAGALCNSAAPESCTKKAMTGLHCDAPGSYACVTAASAERKFCDPDRNEYVDTDACKVGQACDRSDGSCHAVVPACAGHAGGDTVCDGATRHVCGQDLTTSEVHSCKSAQHCEQATGPDCAACTTGEHSCDGAKLGVCNAAHDGFDPVQTCPSAALCSAVAGECSSAPCRVGQAVCEGDALKVCKPDQSGFEPSKPCEPGRCDAAAAQCDVCMRDGCEGDAMRLICAADGQAQTREACPAERGFCVGDGNCVECRTTADCTNPGGDCGTVACSSNRCEVTQQPAGSLCFRGGGECDGHGTCVALVPPMVSAIEPASGLQGFDVDATITGMHLNHLETIEFMGTAGLTIAAADGGTASSLPVAIHIGAAVAPGSYSVTIMTAGGSTNSGSVGFEVLQQPLLRLVPATGAPGIMIEIRAKVGSVIHDPTIAVGMPAVGTAVKVSEDGFEVARPATVLPMSGSSQVVGITIPALQGSWVSTEIVSIVLDYTGPGGPAHGVLEFTYAP